jgi:hypothetical protein
METRKLQFADIEWQNRWNTIGEDGQILDRAIVSADHYDFKHIHVVAWFGQLTCNLDNTADINSILTQTRAFADLLERAKKEYDETIGESGRKTS